ncbi:uncharacterized protein LOC133178684 [Saccostrea echinata]|uniref:uncharacterized protein LOC133178684 n=1 Tax=Saccostrea echinata TaxID=191078 RepID=UPI002A80C73F|nr:uncharacterized protein LOC133178684 [Saccostrea echinata]
MHSVLYFMGLSAFFGIINTKKVSPLPSLKSFRDDYDSVAKTGVAVGYVKDHCKNNQDIRNSIIAFEARAKGSAQTVRQGNIVKFGEVDLTMGGSYNAVKGIFIAPKSGVYIFGWTTLTPNGRYAYTSLVLNGRRKAYNYCHNNNHSITMSCSRMAVVRLTAGDKTWIDTFDGTATVEPKCSSFSGFML